MSATGALAVGLVRPGAAIAQHQQNNERVTLAAVGRTVHARRASRHRRHGLADGVRLPLELAERLARRHVAFERVAALAGSGLPTSATTIAALTPRRRGFIA